MRGRAVFGATHRGAGGLRFVVALLATLVIAPATAAGITPRETHACPAGAAAYAPFYKSAEIFDGAIAQEADFPSSTTKLTGLDVPHHLIAAHLIARGLKAASGHRYSRVILLAPDHFRQTKSAFATTTRGFRTVLGDVPVDVDAARKLIAGGEVEESCLFADEHGVRAILPFIRHYLPDVPVVPIAISIRTTKEDWEHLAAALHPLFGDDTLIVESTDFSHYLPHYEARQRDQQTLNLLAGGTLDQIAALVQPDHVDSLGAFYVQTKLQRDRGSAPVVIASENSQQYTDRFVDETTSYNLVLFGDFRGAYDGPARDGTETYYFAGDTFFGRVMSGVLLDELASRAVREEVARLTLGRPLIVNLEGVLLPDLPANIAQLMLAMPAEQAVEWLKAMNVAAVGLANNHVNDLGPSGLAETTAALDAAGIRWFGQGNMLKLPRLTVAALTDLDTRSGERDLVTDAMIDGIGEENPARPLLAFVHWGREYKIEPGEREWTLAQALRERGVSAIVGAHPHIAGALTAPFGGDVLLAYSLGNFLFDQGEQRASGALLEVQVFRQGTFFARLLPIPNLFALGLAEAQPTR